MDFSSMILPAMLRLFAVSLTILFPALCNAATLRALAWNEEVAGRELALVSGETTLKISQLHPSKRTDPLRIKGTDPIFLRALDKAPAADGKPVQIACVIPEGIKIPLLLILPDPAHPTGVRLLVVDDNPAGFKWGSFRFLNTTPKPLVVQLEQKAVNVPAGWKPVDFDLGGETRGVGARIALKEAIEKPLYSGVWEYDVNVRTLCFLVPGEDPRLGPVAFKSVPEDRQTHEREAAAEAKP
jgi:hypothetical protein